MIQDCTNGSHTDDIYRRLYLHRFLNVITANILKNLIKWFPSIQYQRNDIENSNY